jgi:hypothetical protein
MIWKNSCFIQNLDAFFVLGVFIENYFDIGNGINGVFLLKKLLSKAQMNKT